jgi:predicted Zn-dependent protease
MAIKYYTIYLNRVTSGKSRNEVLIKLGDVYLTKNQMDQALVTYQRVTDKNFEIERDYKIAEMYFYNHEFNAALSHLMKLSTETPVDNPLMNDILTRTMLINSFKKDSVILSEYAGAELLKFQKKYTEAAEVFYKLCRDENSMRSLAGRESAKLYLKLKKFDNAKKVLSFMRRELPEDKDYDEILFLLAESENGLGEFKTAIDIYHEIMFSYPNSLFIQSAREKARTLNTKIAQEQI